MGEALKELLKDEIKKERNEGGKEGSSFLINAIKMLRAGKTEKELLDESIDKDIIEMAYTCNVRICGNSGRIR